MGAHDPGWTPGALDLIRTATSRGWLIFVVDHEAGRARGSRGEDERTSWDAWIAEQARVAGGTIDDFRHRRDATDAELDSHRRTADGRGPGSELVVDLIRAWSLDPTRCVFVGQGASEIEAAVTVGIESHVFPGGDLNHFVEPLIR